MQTYIHHGGNDSDIDSKASSTSLVGNSTDTLPPKKGSRVHHSSACQIRPSTDHKLASIKSTHDHDSTQTVTLNHECISSPTISYSLSSDPAPHLRVPGSRRANVGWLIDACYGRHQSTGGDGSPSMMKASMRFEWCREREL